jgi:hypothetical protein
MAVVPSQASQSPIYDQQGGKIQHWDTGARLEINGVPVALSATFTPAAGASTICNVTIQLQDLASVNCSTVFDLTVWLSDSSVGAGFAAHVPTGGITVTSGTSVFSKVTNIAIEALTTATGSMVLQITDTARTAYFVCTELPGTGLVAVSAQLVTANYG